MKRRNWDIVKTSTNYGWKPLYSRMAATWSPSQKRGGTTRMTGMLSWMATDSLGKTGQQGEVVDLLYM